MSRHRNIRNLTDDDYYDYEDDDYYDEDYDDYGYTEEENEAYYQKQQRLKEEEAKKKKAQAQKVQQQIIKEKKIVVQKTETSNKSGIGNTSNVNPIQNSKEENEKMELVISMGFSSAQAKLALQQNSWDVQLAIDKLLNSGGANIRSSQESIVPSSTSSTSTVLAGPSPPGFGKSTNSKMAPPSGWGKPKNSMKSQSTISSSIQMGDKMAPPPGWGKPKISSATSSKGGKMTPPPGWGKPESTENTKMSSPIKKGLDTSTSPMRKNGNPTFNDGSYSSDKEANGTSRSKKKKIIVKRKKKLSQQLQNDIKGQKSRLSMVILGHVDAGKSTLMGQVCVQLGVVQKRIVDKYQKQAAQIGKASFALAWVMDEDESERERGVTIDIATKHISTEKHELTILDAPGHADFVPAMITGAASADVGILVVAATPGEFESGFNENTAFGVKGHVGQTREHVTLSRGLGVSQLIVAVNKLDAAEPNWSQDRFIEIKRRLVPFLKANGFDMKRVQFVPISGLTGVNIKASPKSDDVASSGLSSWYKQGTLLQAINNFEPAKRNIEKPFRFLVSDIDTEGKYVVVKGRVVQGYISAGDGVVVLPICDAADVGRIEHGVASSSVSERMNIAAAGDSVDLYLTGIDIARIHVGNILSDMSENLRPKLKRKLTAKIIVMDRLTVPIICGSQVLLHMHSLDVPAVISNIISQTDRSDGSLKERPRMLSGGANATVEIKLSKKICLETFSDCRALGRFALRRGGDTVAVGIVDSLSN